MKQSDGTDERVHVERPGQTACGAPLNARVRSTRFWRHANCVPCRLGAAPAHLPRLYVAGPISADPSRTFEEKAAAFERGADALDEAGYVGVPATYVDPQCGKAPDDCVASQVHRMVSQGQGKHSWECYMRGDLRAMLLCDGVALLPGWEMSPGARMEFQVATGVGIEARSLQAWLDQRLSFPEPPPEAPFMQPFHAVDNVCNHCGRPEDERKEVAVQVGGWLHHDCWTTVLDAAADSEDRVTDHLRAD